jgi:hypothetical protein
MAVLLKGAFENCRVLAGYGRGGMVLGARGGRNETGCGGEEERHQESRPTFPEDLPR